MLTASKREARPTAVADVGVLDVAPAVEDRRASNRIQRKLSVKLAATGCTEAHCGPAENICEGGLYLRVPAAYGLRVGQRLEVSFEKDVDAPELSHLAVDTCFATVVRTEMLVAGSSRITGAGLRFDQPLFF